MNIQHPTCSVLALVATLILFAPLSSARAETDPTADHYYRANLLYNRSMPALAIEEYKLFLKAHPDHAKAEEARHGMALSYYAIGKYAEAEPLLRALVEKGRVGNREQLILLSGQCLLELERPAEAEALFASLSGSKSKDITQNVLVGVLEAQRQQGQWKKCMVTAEQLLGADPQPSHQKRALYQAAYAHRQLGQLAQALPYLEKLEPMVKDDPMAPQVAFFLAESYRETGTLDKAAEQYAAAAEGLEKDVAADIYYRLGAVRFAQARYDDAIAACEKSLKLRNEGGSTDEAQLCIGRAWLEKGDFNRAIQELRPLMEQIEGTQPPSENWGGGAERIAAGTPGARAALWLGRAYSRWKKYDEAEKVLSEAIEKSRGKGKASQLCLSPDLLFDYANALMLQGKNAEAASAFAQIPLYTGWPQMNDAMRLHAVCLHRTGDYQASLKAADAFLAGFKSDPLVYEVLFVKAENLYLLNRIDEAAEVFAHVLSTYPESPNVDAVALRLGQIRHKQGRWAEAARVLAPLVARQPEGDAYRQLNFIAGDCNFRLEQWNQAVSNLTAFVNAHTPPLPVDRRNKRDRQQPLPRPLPTEPNFDSALIELALAYVNLRNPQAAMTTLKRLIDDFGESVHRPLAMSELGRLQVEAGDMNGALQTLSSFVDLYANQPQRPKVEYYLAWVALKQNQPATAEQHFAVVANTYARDSLGPDAALQLGLVQLSQKKFQEARSTFDRLIKTYPEHPRKDFAVFSFGVANARMERWDEAVATFRKIAEELPKSEWADDAVYEWAWCEKAMQRNGEAVQRYHYLIATYPESDLRLKAETELAELNYDASKYDEAIAQLTKTVSELKEPVARAPVLYRLGTAYFNKGDFQGSAKTFEEFLRQFPESELRGSALFQAGESRMNIKDIPLARDHFLAASGISGLAPSLKESVLLRLGEAHGLTQQWKESSDAYGALLRAFPESKWARNARFGMALALEKQGQFPQAISTYRTAIDPADKDLLSARAQFQLGECLFAQKKYDEAIRELVPVQVAYRYKDWAAKALLETGLIMEAKGDKDGAITQFKEVVRKFPDDNAAVVAKSRLDVLRREQ